MHPWNGSEYPANFQFVETAIDMRPGILHGSDLMSTPDLQSAA